MTAGCHVVLGACGGLGSAVVRALLAAGLSVVAVTRTQRPDLTSAVQARVGDASDPEQARRLFDGAAVVYHCASVPYAQWATVLPRLMDGVLAGVASTGSRLVYGDNLYMYGPVRGPLTESLPRSAATPKCRLRAVLTERLLEAGAAGRVQATVGCASDLYGPGVTNAVLGGRAIRAALTGQTAYVLGHPDMPHTYTFIDDAARALLVLGQRHEALGQVWHLPSAPTETTRQVLTRLYAACDHTVRYRSLSSLLMAVAGLVHRQLWEARETLYQFEAPFAVDHGKFERAFGASPTPHEEAVRQTLAWFRE